MKKEIYHGVNKEDGGPYGSGFHNLLMRFENIALVDRYLNLRGPEGTSMYSAYYHLDGVTIKHNRFEIIKRDLARERTTGKDKHNVVTLFGEIDNVERIECRIAKAHKVLIGATQRAQAATKSIEELTF